MRALVLSLFMTLFGTAASTAASPRILKVLPQYLDQDGRHSISPSLYDRDAYQAFLRKNPEKRSGLRFAVQWRPGSSSVVTLRVDVRGGRKGAPTQTSVARLIVYRGGFSDWDSVSLDGQAYKDFGDLIAWRVTLWDGDKLLAEQKSFLW